MLKAKPLRRGDTIGLVGISGALHDIETRFGPMLEGIETMGYRVVIGQTCRAQYGYLAGTDAQRAEDLMRMFRNDRVDAVVCMRGGYGVTRMLDRLDFDVIRANPKILLGYSDITALHAAIHQKVGLVTFHGPMPATCWTDMDDYTRDHLATALSSTEPLGRLDNPPGVPVTRIAPGVGEGPIVGGCLSLVAATCGTPYQLDTAGKVLLLEDVGEYVYRLDSMLTQLRLAGLFRRCEAVVLGGFTDCREEFERYTFKLDEVIRDVIVPAGKPVIGNLKIGHTDSKLTIPLGARCRVDGNAGTLEMLEGALEG